MKMHRFEALIVQAISAASRSMPWKASLAFGARVGDGAWHLGMRRAIAEDNVRRAFPDWDDAARMSTLRKLYHELGRIAMEYPRLPELARAEPGRFVASITGLEHLFAARERGRGALIVAGHCGNFDLCGASLARHHPVDAVVRPMSNARVDAWLNGRREQAGVRVLRADRQIRDVYDALRKNRWVCMLADQDARRDGVFVPFLGRPASTATGPARVALATGAAVVTGGNIRLPDGRHAIEFEPAIEHPEGPKEAAVYELTRRHVERLEARVRRDPWNWFWLHRRWKTAPPA